MLKLKQKELFSLMNKRLIIEEPFLNENDEISWKKFRSYLAYVSVIYDARLEGETFFASQIMADNYYRFVIRYNKNINNQMRIIYKNHVFDIKKVINDKEENRFLMIIAKEQI